MTSEHLPLSNRHPHIFSCFLLFPLFPVGWSISKEIRNSEQQQLGGEEERRRDRERKNERAVQISGKEESRERKRRIKEDREGGTEKSKASCLNA